MLQSCNIPCLFRGRFGLLSRSLLVATLCACSGWGCGNEALTNDEIKRIDEKVTEQELQTFFTVIDSLSVKKLPEMPSVYSPPPDWSAGRSRPIGELVKEEYNAIDERWDIEMLVGHLRRKKRLQRILRREEMTPEQFVGLSLSIGIALSRNTIRGNQNLKEIVTEGNSRIARLENETDLFSSLIPELRHAVLQRAIWITRTERAQKLLLVPPENVALVQNNLERLEAIFPEFYTTNPLDPVADLRTEKGLPFEELKSSGYDSQIEWSVSEAIIGHDIDLGDEQESDPAETDPRVKPKPESAAPQAAVSSEPETISNNAEDL